MGQFKDKNGKTRVGTFLSSLGNIGDDILQFAGDVTGIEALERIGDAISKNQELKAEEKKIALDLLNLDIQDRNSAREKEAKVQASENASWMAKNMPYLYDSFILLIWGFMTVYLVLRWIGIIANTSNIDMTGILGIYAAVTGLATNIISYHRGSSAGSTAKNNLLGNFNKK